MLNIGIDFHDTISYNPEFFKALITDWKGKVFIVTGTPISNREETIKQLKDVGITRDMYEEILMGFNYIKEDMTLNHFHKMKEHKLQHIKDNNISIYFDDNHNVTVFQTILNDKYLDEFENKHNFFTCNLQRDQFSYLNQPQLEK